MKETKEFYKTSEFWLLIISQIILTLQTSDVIQLMAERYNWITPILQVVIAAAYIVSRGKAKSGVPVPEGSLPPVGAEEFSSPDLVIEPGTNVSADTGEIPADTAK